MMNIEDHVVRLNVEGPDLLSALVDDANGPDAMSFDALAFPVVVDFVSRKGDWLMRRASDQVGRPLPRYEVSAHAVDDVAQETAMRTTRRIRKNASVYERSGTSLANWVVGKAALIYHEVCKEFDAKQQRLGVLTDPAEFEFVGEVEGAEETVERLHAIERLAHAASLLSREEFIVVRLRHCEDWSKPEIAERLYGTREKTKRVDRILQQAMRKLREELAGSEPLTQANLSGSNVRYEIADEEDR
jgi:RNA polymerase sigma factor (sigma-70 family)